MPAVVLIGGGVTLRSSGMLGVELECEQAVAHLKSCCPDLDVTVVDCGYERGCGDADYPTFTSGQSKCIQNLSCEAIHDVDLCEKLTPYGPEGQTPGLSDDLVCPQ